MSLPASILALPKWHFSFGSCMILRQYTLFKKGVVLDIDTCEHGDSLKSQHLIQLDHGNLDFKFEQENFEKFKFLTFFIK